MKTMKKPLQLLAMLVLAVAICALLGACGKTEDATPTTEPAATTPAESSSYTVTVKTAGGMAMENVSVSVFADETMSDLKGTGMTDASGTVKMDMPASQTPYKIVLSGYPKGYNVDAFYSFDGTSASIVLSSSLIKGENLGDNQVKLGDVMYDFTVNTPDKEQVTLSKLLETKKMVLLNFWYTTCSWCVKEFPYMEQAYQQYQDDVAIVALDPLEDTEDEIKNFAAANGLELTFPMAKCPSSWSNTFNLQGYPTSVVIDRYGVVVLIESGAITSLQPFTSLFETLTADNYQQKLYNEIAEVVTRVKPTYDMPANEVIENIMGTADMEVTFRAEEGEDAEYSWPFIEAEKNGFSCLKASNAGQESSYAILYADVTLKAGEALGIDFFRSSELNGDFFHIIVDDEPVYSISGTLTEEKWETCYPLVAEKDGTYEVAICYIKDESDAVGDDTFYIKNMRIVSPEEIDAPTYLPRAAATKGENGKYSYVDIVLNETDGYYHVGTADGPLLLADLMGYTDFDKSNSVWDMASNNKIIYNGVNYLGVRVDPNDAESPRVPAVNLTTYASYASNSQLNGICPVNQELFDLLTIVDKVQGFDSADDMEWLKLCKYFTAYGTGGEQLVNPIAGISVFSALEANLGKNVPTNCFYYDRIIMPRGMFAEFVPSRSGVYRITSRTDSGNRVDGWIFNANTEILLTYEWDERLYTDGNNVSMVFYMEAGKPYYINIAFWDLYEVGYVYYDIEFLGSSYSFFRNCSPGPFTYISDETGTAMLHTIAKGIDVVLGDDGIYYHDLGGGKKGSPIYVDFTSAGDILGRPFVDNGDIKGVISLGGFDFSKTDNDLYVLSIMELNGNDSDKTIAYLKEFWGESYEEYYELYQVNDVLNGDYHGLGEDMTDEINKYLDDIITTGPAERQGCVVVTEELAELLQLLMDKYTFKGVETSWRKLCYYYDYMG